MAESRTCRECKYWEGASFDSGHCRRDPPRIPEKSNDYRGCWPITKPEDWCGEFAPLKRPSFV